jgi:hypothetical protein
MSNNNGFSDFREDAIRMFNQNKTLTASVIAKAICEAAKLPYNETRSRAVRGWLQPFRDNIGDHTGLVSECETVGIPAEDVKQYWYKGEHFSINVNGAVTYKSAIDEFNEYIEEVRDTIANSFEWKKNDYSSVNSNNIFVPSIFDLHLGKLAWGEETGEDYDIHIAQDRFHTAINDLINKSSGYNVDEILFPVGNDIYNSDKALPYSQTTAGTPQMDDTRWQKMFRIGVRLITEAIIKLSEIAPVKVPLVYSNHDFERVFYLGEVLSAVFANNPNVIIDNNPRVRKYYQFGKVLIATAHGHNEKPTELPLIMAQEVPDMWSSTWYREWLLGHLHHKYNLMTQTAKDYKGINVRYLTSPSAPDAWHYNKAYIGSIKGAEGFIYNKEEGLVGTVVHNIK